MTAVEGTTLWRQDDESDGLYIIESGVLRASYAFPNRLDSLEESMVGGTLAGELSALSNLPRNATVVVEKDAVLWKFSVEELRNLQAEQPVLAQTFVHLVLKGNISRIVTLRASTYDPYFRQLQKQTMTYSFLL